MLHVLKITMYAPNGCYSKASSLNHLFLALPKGGQRLCGEEKQAKILPITSVYGAWTKGQFDMESDTTRPFGAQWFMICSKCPKLGRVPY